MMLPHAMKRDMRLMVILALAVGMARLSLAMPSHLKPHLYDYAPPALLEPLDEDETSVLKGWSPVDEQSLQQSLTAADLKEKVVKIAVYRALGCKVAAIKLQAGDWDTGRFSVDDVNADAIKALKVAFDGPDPMDHVDLWAAVPMESPEQHVRWHWPVFSVSTWKDRFEKISADLGKPVEALGKLGLVRYDPLLLDNASDRADIPPGAVTLPVADLTGQRDVSDSDSASTVCSALCSGNRASRTVAITIDDGPHPVISTLLVKVLADEHVHATFFVVGEKALQHPELIREIAAGGNEIGNHTYTHRRLTDIRPDIARSELAETSRLIEALVGKRCRLMRPPGGDLNPAALAVCHEEGLLPVFWTRNTGDWESSSTVHDVVEKALRNVHAGDVILMHQARPDSAEALRDIIIGLRRLGLRPGCVGDLLQGAPLIRGRASTVIAQLKARGALVRE